MHHKPYWEGGLEMSTSSSNITRGYNVEMSRESRSWEIGKGQVMDNNNCLHLLGASYRSGTFIPIVLINFLNSMSAIISPHLHVKFDKLTWED